MGGFSPWHLLVVAIVAAILFFGWKQLPDMARSLGRSMRIFKTEIKGMAGDDKAREDARTEPAAIEAPRAQIIRNEVPAQTARPVPPQSERSSPRPSPNPNGRAQTPTPGGQ